MEKDDHLIGKNILKLGKIYYPGSNSERISFVLSQRKFLIQIQWYKFSTEIAHWTAHKRHGQSLAWFEIFKLNYSESSSDLPLRFLDYLLGSGQNFRRSRKDHIIGSEKISGT